MARETDPVFVRVSTDAGHFSMPAAIAERGKLTVLKSDALDKAGHPLPPKLRAEIADTPKVAKRAATRRKAAKKAAAPELREQKPAATPTEPEVPASGDTSEE